MATVQTRSFLPGEKVALFERYGGGPLSRSNKLLDGPKKVPASGELEFTGLAEGQTVYLAREDGSSAIQATAKTPEKPKQRISDQEARRRLAGSIWQTENKTVIEGARTTASRGGLGQPFVNPESGSKTPKEVAVDPRHPRIEDFGHVAQRSATVTGLATPVGVDPRPEGVPQSDARKVEQSSATEHGLAAPRDPEADPAEGLRQEDAGKVAQQSATDTGIQTPVPATAEGKPETVTRKPQSKQSAPKQEPPARPQRSPRQARDAAKKDSRSGKSSANRRSSGRK